MIDKKKLIEAGVQFGHQKSKWCPKMKPYIWGFKNNIHLIDVSKTADLLEKATKFLENIAASGKPILLVGTKKAAQNAIYNIAEALNLPYVNNRWIGGTFSNFRQVKKSVANYLHFKDILEKSSDFNYTKQELNLIQKKIGRLEKNIGGIVKLSWPIGAVLVVDAKKEDVCIKEAVSMGIPIVAIVDTNSNPTNVDYVIPANDDSPKSIDLLLNYVANGIKVGQELARNSALEEAKSHVEVENMIEPGVTLESEEDNDNEKSNKKQKSSHSPSATKTTKKIAKPKFFKKTRTSENLEKNKEEKSDS